MRVNSRESWRSISRLEVIALKQQKSDWQPASGDVVITFPGALTNYFSGQEVEVTGVISYPPSALAPGLFDYRSFLQDQGIYFRLQTDNEADWRIVSAPANRPLAERFQSWSRRALGLGLPKEDTTLRLEWALALGWKTALTEEVSEPFIQAATYHIFAVDGLRMAIVFSIFFGLFHAIRVPRWFTELLLLPVLWFYVGLTGWPASAIRATVMLSIVIIGRVLKRPANLINSLFVAAWIILLWDPLQLFQAGFQLSFLVVLCIILTVPVLHCWAERLIAPDPLLPVQLHKPWHPLLRVPALFVWDLLLVSFCSWLGALPLVAYYFNIVTPISTPANILAVPLCALTLISNFAALLTAPLFLPAAVLFNHAGWFLMECIRVTSVWFASWPRAWFYVPAPSILTTVCFYALLLSTITGWLFSPRYRLWKILGLSLLLLTWTFQFYNQSGVTKLTVLPSDGGSTIFYDPPGTKDDLLISCGSQRTAQLLTKPFLRAQGITRLSRLVLTHGESRRIGGAGELVQDFSVQKLCISPAKFRSVVYRRILDGFRDKPDRLQPIERGKELASWTVLHPDSEDHFSRADDSSIVLLKTIADTRILLLADLGPAGQEALLKRYPDLRSDIVVTGLPVQGQPLGDDLIEALRPSLIIVTDAETPAKERASPQLKQRLAEHKVPVLYTRTTGTISFEFKKKSWELRTQSGESLSSLRAWKKPSENSIRVSIPEAETAAFN